MSRVIVRDQRDSDNNLGVVMSLSGIGVQLTGRLLGKYAHRYIMIFM